MSEKNISEYKKDQPIDGNDMIVNEKNYDTDTHILQFSFFRKDCIQELWKDLYGIIGSLSYRSYTLKNLIEKIAEIKQTAFNKITTFGIDLTDRKFEEYPSNIPTGSDITITDYDDLVNGKTGIFKTVRLNVSNAKQIGEVTIDKLYLNDSEEEKYDITFTNTKLNLYDIKVHGKNENRKLVLNNCELHIYENSLDKLAVCRDNKIAFIDMVTYDDKYKSGKIPTVNKGLLILGTNLSFHIHGLLTALFIVPSAYGSTEYANTAKFSSVFYEYNINNILYFYNIETCSIVQSDEYYVVSENYQPVYTQIPIGLKIKTGNCKLKITASDSLNHIQNIYVYTTDCNLHKYYFNTIHVWKHITHDLGTDMPIIKEDLN